MGCYRRAWLPLLAGALLAGCGDDPGYDAPDQSEPFDSIAPAPNPEIVPGADEPGPQQNEPGG